MSSFSSPHATIPPHLSVTQQQLDAFPAYTQWLRTLTASLAAQSAAAHPFHSDPYTLRTITLTSATHFGPRLGFVTLDAHVANAGGETLPGTVFLRGGSVAMLLVLTERGAADEWAVLTVQARVPAGSLALAELPAGMLDAHATFAGAAATEIEQECGIVIREDELLDLGKMAGLEGGVFPSPGGCDEEMRLFACRHAVEKGRLAEWRGKLTGLRDEGEKITLKLVKLENLWKETRDAKALCAVALWDGLRKEGKL